MSFAISSIRAGLTAALVLAAGVVQAQSVTLQDPGFNTTTVGYEQPWNIWSGTPTVESGHMHLDADDSIWQRVTLDAPGLYTIGFDVQGEGRSRLFLTSDVYTNGGPQATSGAFLNAITNWGPDWTHTSYQYQFSGAAGTTFDLFFSGKTTGMNIDNITMGFSPSAVPEPESYAMMLAGFGLMGVMARRRRSR